MAEKTAEEKLRQALEGSTTEGKGHETPKESRKPRPRTRTRTSSRNERPENLGQRVDSFMEDFERRIEQSLNAVNSPSEHQEQIKPRRSSKPSRKNVKPETHHEVHRKSEILPEIPQPEPLIPEIIENVADALNVPEISLPEPVQEAIDTIAATSNVQEFPQPEIAPAIAEAVAETPGIHEVKEPAPEVNEPETAPEVIKPETAHEITEPKPAHEVIEPETAPEVTEPETAPEVTEPKTLPEVTEPETIPEVIEPETIPEVTEPKTLPEVTEPETIPEVIEPETIPEIIEPETAPEITEPKTIPEVIEPEPAPEVIEPETIPEITEVIPETFDMPEIPYVPSEPELPEIEPLDDTPQEAPESVPEAKPEEAEIIPDVEPADDTPIAPEFPDIPVIEADFYQPQEDTQASQETDGGLPDIPVITPDDDETDDFDNFAEDFISETTEDESTDENPSPDTADVDEPAQETSTEFQEAELFEAPEIEDEFADITDENSEEITDAFSDEPIDEGPAIPENDEDLEDAPPYDMENDEAGIFTDDETGDTQEEFSPAADVVLNVDDELPQISAHDEPEISDEEAEPVPVTVTMPESTKTAEDKLMADIAEAMTGSPLSLGSQEQAGLYNLPEDFFANDGNSGDSQQSAEDKLKANIAQALSESPISAAQNQARQDLEQDINPFDELSMPDTLFQRNEEEPDLVEEPFAEDAPTTKEITPEEGLNVVDIPAVLDAIPELEPEPEHEASPQVEDNEFENDPFTIPDFGDDDEHEKQPEPETETEALPQVEDNEAENDPFTIPDFGDDETEQEEQPEFELASETEPELEPEPTPEFEPEPETEPEVPETFTEIEDDSPFPVDEAEPEVMSEPLTEQDRLAQEVAAMTQEVEPEDNIPDTMPEFELDNIQEEAAQENNMPEQSLLNDDTPENLNDSANDDWDISSLGELGAAATIPGDDPDDFHAEPETVTEVITAPENLSAGIVSNPEDEHKEKTMSIREKLASRKNAASDSNTAGKKKSSGGGGGGFLLPLLLTAIAVIGGLMLWQIMTLSDKLTSMAMNSPNFESSSSYEAPNPSYDYAIDFILDPNLTDRMSQRGRDGWQVVGSRRTQDSTTGQYGYEFIFMRRTPGR